jgi:hypothetical protein
VALLPDNLEQEQLEVIEAALQMAPNLKLEYGWINRRLKLRQHVRDLDREQIIEAYRFPDAAAIDVELGELKLAESYLEWIGRPRRFALVADRERHFTKMHEKLQLLKYPHVRDVWTLFGFAMLRAEGAIDGKILHYFPFTDPVPAGLRHWVPRTLAEDRGLTDRQDVGENHPLDKALAARLRPLIDDPRHAESIATAVVALSDTLKGNERKLVGFDQLLVQLRRAHETLQQIEKLSPAQLRRLRAQIAALREHVGGSRQGTATSSEFPAPKRDLQAALHHAWRDAKRILWR